MNDADQINHEMKADLSALRCFGVNVTNGIILYHLMKAKQESKEEGIYASIIARELEITPAAMTTNLDKMESLGLLNRIRSPKDRRKCLISLTEQGCTSAKKIFGK